MRKADIVRAAQLGVNNLIGSLHVGLANFRHAGRTGLMRQIRQIKRDRKMLLTPTEAYQLYAAAAAVRRIAGDAAEVGVFRGASAKLIRMALPDKPLHLFDTFEGLPLPRSADGDLLRGEFSCGLDEVKQYLASEPNLHFHAGVFPASGAAVRACRFAFVHLDVDLYEGTLAALQWFFPKMHLGGIILIHDYAALPGPTQACNDFFRERRDPMVELAGNQCMAIKISDPEDSAA